jgi:UDP-glucose 4-epimerase
MSTILITGGAGYIGSHFAYKMLDLGFKIIIIDNLSTGFKKLIPQKATFFKGDITNIGFLKKIFQKKKIEAVFHFAGNLSVQESNTQPLKYFKNNVIGTKNILDTMVMYKVKYFIFSSTCAVYGDTKKKKVKENENCNPKNYYGLTKLQCENLIQQYRHKFKFKYAILRYFNVVGCDSKCRTGIINKGSLFKNLSFNINKKKYQIDLYGNNYKTRDGTCIRDYIDVNDLTNLHLEALQHIRLNESILLNCGYEKPLSVKDIIKLFQKTINKKIKIIIKKKRTEDIEEIYCDTTKLKKKFPKFKRENSIKQSIQNMIKWEKTIN